MEVISKNLKKSELEVIEKIRELHNTGYYLNT
jgi:biotin operon repressor